MEKVPVPYYSKWFDRDFHPMGSLPSSLKKSPKKTKQHPTVPDREVGHDIGETPNEWKLPTNHLPLGMVIFHFFQVMRI